MNPSYNNYINKGLSGIVNFGNTCYMNSAIQCLSHTLLLTDLFLSKKYLKKIEGKKEDLNINFSKNWYSLMNGLWEDNCTVSPKSLFNLLKKISRSKNIDISINESNQNDIHEFLILLLDLFHKSFREKYILYELDVKDESLESQSKSAWNKFFEKDYSIINDIFYGQILTEIKDIETNNVYSNTFQPLCFFTLPVFENIKSNTLYDCFDEYLKREELYSHKVDIEKEEKVINVYKEIKIFRFPKIMIIIFNRFNNNNYKINTLIDFPEDLDLSKYNNNTKLGYELYSICNHYGSCGGGHYTSYCKNNNKWYEFNDNSVKLVSDINKNNAYCLFYKKK